MSNGPRLSFDKDLDTAEMETNKGLKLKPRTKRVPKADRQAALDHAAKTTTQKLEGHLQEALELGQEFIRIMASRKVPSQKGPTEASLEKEVARNWQRYILRINNDEFQPEGMGSAGALSLVFSCLLKLRDRTNIIEHECILLKQENVLLKKRLDDLEEYTNSLKNMKPLSSDVTPGYDSK